MILESLDISAEEFARRTGWVLKPEGVCKGDVCVPLPSPPGPRLDVRGLAERLGMPLVHDDEHGLWALGPESGGRALTSVEAPDLTLPEWRGGEFSLSSLRGQKVLLLAWASW